MKGEEWDFGRRVERDFVGRLVRRGWLVVPLYGAVGVDESTKAPMLYGPTERLVSPDVLATKESRSIWLEIKGKRQPGYHFKAKRWEHGIDWHLVGNYQKVEALSGWRVHLVVYEAFSPPVGGGSPEWSERHQEVFGGMEAADRWLTIPLSKALDAGHHQSSWPDGCGGRSGQGGLLWPRGAMREVAW